MRIVPEAVLDDAQELLLVHELSPEYPVDVAAGDFHRWVVLEDFFNVRGVGLEDSGVVDFFRGAGGHRCGEEGNLIENDSSTGATARPKHLKTLRKQGVAREGDGMSRVDSLELSDLLGRSAGAFSARSEGVVLHVS